MELKHLSLIFLFGANFSVWVGSTTELNLADTVIYLKQKNSEMEGRMSLLENRGAADLVQEVKNELLVAVQETERKSLEAKNQILAKMEEMETESKNLRNDLSAKLQELQQWTLEQSDEVLKRVTEVEMRCERSTASLAEKLQNAESRFKKVDNHLLMEVLQLKPMLKETIEKVRSGEEQVTTAMESERLKTHSLQVKITEITSQLFTEDILRRNMSTLADDLRLKLNESLKFGFESIQSNLTTKIRVLENLSMKLEKDCANISYVSMLHDSLRNLEESTKNELGILQSELFPRIEVLEEKGALCNDIPDMKKTLGNHSSQLNTLNQQLLYFHKTCDDEPPSLLNGKALHFERKPGSVVRYECDRNFVMVGNSTVNCTSGKWVGRLPVCRFFDASLTLVTIVWSQITCYSDEYSQRIQFSRVHASGRESDLPTGAKTIIRRKAADLDLSGLLIGDRNGLYKCGIEENNTSVAAVVPFQYQYADFNFMHSSEVANIRDTIELKVTTSRDTSKLRWKRNGEPVPSWDGAAKVTIRNVQPADAGIYECNHDRATALIKLIVRKCEKGRYGENCDMKCPPCYNGGICHDVLGICVCPPGFSGNSCEVACGESRFGADCSQTCLKSNCNYHIFCKSDPYGCSCAPGFTRYTCFKACDPGWYGADCKQPCHCVDGASSCNRYTGACRGGCSPGWTGQSCQIEVVK